MKFSKTGISDVLRGACSAYCFCVVLFLTLGKVYGKLELYSFFESLLMEPRHGLCLLFFLFLLLLPYYIKTI